MEFIRHRWKMILLMALLIAAILGGAMLFWSSTREKTYTGGLFVEGRTAERSCGRQDVNCRESVCGFPAAKKLFLTNLRFRY